MYFQLPNNTRRVILVSNIASPPSFEFRQGDIIIEFNKALHHPRLMAIKEQSLGAIQDLLVVRHTKDKHFLPDNFASLSTTWDNIILTTPNYGFNTESWFQSYCRVTQKYPTTGYAVYKMIRTRDKRIPIVGLGFRLDDNTSPHNQMHAWEYEYKEYSKDKHFTNL